MGEVVIMAKTTNSIITSKGLILTINLKGCLAGPEPKAGIVGTVKVPFQVKINPKTGKREYFDWRDVDAYGHNDRKETSCVKKVILQPYTLRYFATERPIINGRPVKKSAWNEASPDEKILMHLSLFDEGYGISYKLL